MRTSALRPMAVAFALFAITTLAAPAATVEAAFNSASVVPITSSTYVPSADDLRIYLGFAPPRGTALTVIRNTGAGFINGRFTNLKHGQLVKLKYSGTTYRFVANYYGGSGNDLVLEWGFRGAYAWGDGQAGQLGNGGNTASRVPVTVNNSGALAGKTVMRVAAGHMHSLALCADGTLATWGANQYGQLGDNKTAHSSVPVLVPLTGVLDSKTPIAIAAGDYHNLVLCSDGTLVSWGLNTLGQLGNPLTDLSRVPVAVSPATAFTGKTIRSIAAGANHNVVLCTDGTLVSWGYNNLGQLGNNTQVSTATPQKVKADTAISGRVAVAIAAGDLHSLALFADGSLAGWGSSNSGQLGSAFASGRSLEPVIIPSTGALAGKSITSLAAGSAFSLALATNGSAATWGNNTYGELGDGKAGNSSTPVNVTKSGTISGKTFTEVAAGRFHGLALCSDGTIAAWGVNTQGQLGNNSTSTSGTPVAVIKSGVLANATPVAIAAHGFHSLAVAATPAVNATNETSLTQLEVGGEVPLSPSFTSGHLAYQVAVPATTSSMTFTPTAANPAAKVTIKDIPVASGEASPPIPLNQGFNNIVVQVKAADDTASSYYFITVTRASLSADAALSGLTVAGASLAPSFAPAMVNYVGTVDPTTTSVVVTPTANDPTATITLNGTDVSSGEPVTVPLGIGLTTIEIKVTAANGMIFRNYRVQIDRNDYAVWLADQALPPNSSPTDDPDHDGFPNLLEYVLAGNPLAASSPQAPMLTVDPEQFIFQFSRRKDSATVSQQVLEISEDLEHWSPIFITPPIAPNVAFGEVQPDGTQNVTVTVPRDGRSRLIGRLKASRP